MFAVYLVVSAILFALIADIVLVGIGIAGSMSYCSKKCLFIIVFYALTFGLCMHMHLQDTVTATVAAIITDAELDTNT